MRLDAETRWWGSSTAPVLCRDRASSLPFLTIEDGDRPRWQSAGTLPGFRRETMYDIDDLTDALEEAKRELDRATDDYEAAKFAYYADPCATTKRKLLKAKSDLEAANAEYEEPLPWE